MEKGTREANAPAWKCRGTWIGLALAVLACVPNFVYPYFEDAAHYAVAGRLMNEGLLPYRDTIVQKGPATFVTTWLLTSLLGSSSVAARGFELAVILAMAAACARIARRAAGPAATPVGLVVAAVLSSGVFWAIVERSQVEWYQAAATAWAVALAVDWLHHGRARALVAAGALMGLACWFKPQAALAGVGLGLVLVARALRSRDMNQAARITMFLAAGVVAVSLPLVLWMAATGILDDFWHQMVDYNLAYLGIRERPSVAMAIEQALSWPWLHASGMFVLAGAGAAGLAWLVLPDSYTSTRAPLRRWIGALVGAWLVASFAQFVSGRYLFRYHQVILVPSVAVIATSGLVALRSWFDRLAGPRVRPALARAVVVLMALAMAIAVLVNDKYANEWRSVARYLAGDMSGQQVYARHGRRLHYYYYPTQRALAEYIKARTRPNDTVQLMGRGGTFYLYVERRPATRYLITQIVFDRRRLDWAPRFAAFLRELETARPAYIVVRGDDEFPWFGLPASNAQVTHEPHMMSFLKENYQVEGLFRDVALVFRRNDHTPPGATLPPAKSAPPDATLSPTESAPQ